MDIIKKKGNSSSNGMEQDQSLNKEIESLDPVISPVFTKGRYTTKTDPDDQVSISIKLLVSERNKIHELRLRRSPRNKVSLQNWIIEAITEKIKNDDNAS